jgi:hypothetical protein
MTRLNLSAILLLTSTLLIAPRAAHAAESYDNCTGTITSLPAAISTQGTWCLKQNLSTALASGAAITINTNNVTIDCNYFILDGSAAGVGSSTTGIYATNRLNATVRHCNIRGFISGVSFTGTGTTGGHVVEDNNLNGNTNIGIYVSGDGSIIRRNRILNTGGSTVVGYAYGIQTQFSVDVLDNTVSGVSATPGSNGFAYGLFINSNPNGRVIGNSFRGLLKDGTGAVYGVYSLSSTAVVYRNNDLVGDGSGGSAGLVCNTASGSFANNVISDFAIEVFNCTDSGGNDYLP